MVRAGGGEAATAEFSGRNASEPAGLTEVLADHILPQEVEVAAVIGLEHVVHVETPIAAFRRCGDRARGPALREHGLVHDEIEPAVLHAEPDAIARLS